MGPDNHAGCLQLRRQLLRSSFQRIHLNRQRRRSVVGHKAGFRLRPQNGLEAFHQPLGMAVPDGEAVQCILVRDPRQVYLVPGELPQHRVHQPGCLGPAVVLGLLHRLIDSGAVGNFIQKQNLISPNPQNFQQRRLQVVDLLGAVGTQVEVQQQPVLHHAVDDAAAQRRLWSGQAVPAELGPQGRIRPGPGRAAAHQDAQGGVPGIRGPHWLPP